MDQNVARDVSSGVARGSAQWRLPIVVRAEPNDAADTLAWLAGRTRRPPLHKLLAGVGFVDQRAESIYRDAECAAGEAVHVGGVHADDLSLGIEDGAAAAAVGCGSIIDELVADYIAEVAAGRRRANQ